MKKTLLSLSILLGIVGVARAQQNQNLNNVEIHILPAQGNVYMLVGVGGNITVQAGSDGVLVVDTQYAPHDHSRLWTRGRNAGYSRPRASVRSWGCDQLPRNDRHHS